MSAYNFGRAEACHSRVNISTSVVHTGVFGKCKQHHDRSCPPLATDSGAASTSGRSWNAINHRSRRISGQRVAARCLPSDGAHWNGECRHQPEAGHSQQPPVHPEMLGVNLEEEDLLTFPPWHLLWHSSTANWEDAQWLPHEAGGSSNNGSSTSQSTGAHAAAPDSSSSSSSSSNSLWHLTDRPGMDLLQMSYHKLMHMQQVYAIQFASAADSQQAADGIYSLRAFTEEGLPQETIIVFESQEDAQRYACMLEASMGRNPLVCGIAPLELRDFCVTQGYQCRLEPRGSLIIPPDYTVTVTDWELSMRLRDGRFAVLESDPHTNGPFHHGSSSGANGSGSSDGSGGSQQQQPGVAQLPHFHPRPGPHAAPGASPSASPFASSSSSSMARFMSMPEGDELQALRARLEALLPMDGDSNEDSNDPSTGQ